MGCGCKYTEAKVENMLSQRNIELSKDQYAKLWSMIGDDRIDPEEAVDEITKMKKGGTLKSDDCYPFKHREANEKQKKIILEVFNIGNRKSTVHIIPAIEDVLGDVIDLYQNQQWYRTSDGSKYQTIGASICENNYFYMMDEDGAIELIHNYSMFPTEPPESVSEDNEANDNSEALRLKAKAQKQKILILQLKLKKNKPTMAFGGHMPDKRQREIEKLNREYFVHETITESEYKKQLAAIEFKYNQASGTKKMADGGDVESLEYWEKIYNENIEVKNNAQFGYNEKSGRTFAIVEEVSPKFRALANYAVIALKNKGYQSANYSIAKSGTIYVSKYGSGTDDIRIADHAGRGGLWAVKHDVRTLSQLKEALSNIPNLAEAEASEKDYRQQRELEWQSLVEERSKLQTKYPGYAYKENSRTYETPEQFTSKHPDIIYLRSIVVGEKYGKTAYKHQYLAPRDGFESQAPPDYIEWIKSHHNETTDVLKMHSGGDVEKHSHGGVQFIEYKGHSIMYEPIYNEYFVEDEMFDSLDKAKKYIDRGSPPSAKVINAYRHGAFENGGEIHICDELKQADTVTEMTEHLHGEHDEALKRISEIQGSPEVVPLIIDLWENELRSHFAEEETVLFPRLLKDRPNTVAEINEILRQHKQFNSLIEQIRIAHKSNSAGMSLLVADFINLLRNHIKKENHFFASVSGINDDVVTVNSETASIYDLDNGKIKVGELKMKV